MKHLTILLAALFCACHYNDFGPYERQETTSAAANLTIASLRGYYPGHAVNVTQEMIVEGSVTSSDKANNFHRTLVVEDATGALEIKTGLYDMHNAYPVGQRLSVRLRGMALAMDAGLLQAGAPAPSYSFYGTDYLGHRVIVERHVARTGAGATAPVTPAVHSVASLSEVLCGRLVRVPALHLAGATASAAPPVEAVSWADPSTDRRYPPVTGYRKFKDPAGDSLLVVVSGYANFATAQIPAGVYDITGILLRGTAPGSGGRTMYMLKIRDLADIGQ